MRPLINSAPTGSFSSVCDDDARTGDGRVRLDHPRRWESDKIEATTIAAVRVRSLFRFPMQFIDSGGRREGIFLSVIAAL